MCDWMATISLESPGLADNVCSIVIRIYMYGRNIARSLILLPIFSVAVRNTEYTTPASCTFMVCNANRFSRWFSNAQFGTRMVLRQKLKRALHDGEKKPGNDDDDDKKIPKRTTTSATTMRIKLTAVHSADRTVNTEKHGDIHFYLCLSAIERHHKKSSTLSPPSLSSCCFIHSFDTEAMSSRNETEKNECGTRTTMINSRMHLFMRFEVSMCRYKCNVSWINSNYYNNIQYTLTQSQTPTNIYNMDLRIPFQDRLITHSGSIPRHTPNFVCNRHWPAACENSEISIHEIHESVVCYGAKAILHDVMREVF